MHDINLAVKYEVSRPETDATVEMKGEGKKWEFETRHTWREMEAASQPASPRMIVINDQVHCYPRQSSEFLCQPLLFVFVVSYLCNSLCMHLMAGI